MKFVPRPLDKTADASRGDDSWSSFAKNAASVVIVLGLGYLALGLVADLLAHTVPDRWEARFLASVPDEALAPREGGRAESTFFRLTSTPGLRDLPYQLFVLPIGEPNAFAFPGGGVAVTRGLLDTLDSEVGLATVLGHELGHHQGRHPLKRLGRSLLFQVVRGALFGAGDTSVVDASLALAESGYSRRQESRADEFGLRLVHSVYGHTEGSLEFFEKVQADRLNDESSWASFVRSHPLTSDRIEELEGLRSQLNQGDSLPALSR